MHEKESRCLCNITREKEQISVDITREREYTIIRQRERQGGRSKRKLNQERKVKAERDKGD